MPLRWGLVGPGRIAHRFADALAAVPGARLVAVTGRDADRAREFASRWVQAGQMAAAGSDLNALLNDPEVDAVYVATPHSAHAEAVAAALRAGKPVLCEKPLAPTAAQAEVLVALARERGVFLMEAVWTRCLPAVLQVGDWLRAGAIGRVLDLQSSFGFKLAPDPQGRHFNPALGGGALLDIGIYNLSMSQWVLGLMGEHGAPAFHIHGRLAGTGVEQRAAVQLDYRNGVSSQFVCAFDGDAENAFHIHGELGRITLGAGFWECRQVSLRRPGQPAQELSLPFARNGFEYELIEAQRCIHAGLIESPLIPHEGTLATLRLIDAMREQLGVRYPFE